MQALGADAAETKVSRSFLFVPADSERKLAKARDTSADALIIDLEDSVAASARPKAREIAQDFLADKGGAELWVRINPLDTEDALQDLRAVMPSGPRGIILPKPIGARESNQLAKLLDVLELEGGHSPGQTSIIPIATERPAALFKMHEYADATARLLALSWGAEDLSSAVGASANRDESGNWLPPYELARSLCLFAASAAAVVAIDTVYTDYRDLDGLATYAARARRDGFEGMLAIHPDQVAVINAAFAASAAEIERANRIVELFAANPDAGTLGLDGEMIDRPHLLQAQRILRKLT
ncbi:MAG: CoA ester lyase [Gammaproteobacteria bacterium]|nr:MAG: CoA ester lyase [Gammaproteobacteria bacterium]RLA32040.1 MAG: CoA ester lyase [Gammaproteobacteria bacterium]